MNTDNKKSLTIKLEDSTRQTLKRIAKTESRSLHGQIVYILKQAAEAAKTEKQ
jgi:hypothetical protein